MKKWMNAEIVELSISDTAHDWQPQPSLDGGYLGDGQLSGWFGSADGNNSNGNSSNTNGSTTPDTNLNSPS